jgi:hypothetical protein
MGNSPYVSAFKFGLIPEIKIPGKQKQSSCGRTISERVASAGRLSFLPGILISGA